MVLHRRQAETALSSLVDEVFTVTPALPPGETGLVPLPSYIVTIISPPSGIAVPTESGAWSGSATPGAGASGAGTLSTSSPAPGSSGSSGSSGPSAGLIAGAVIGSVAVLVLVGILVMLILRHKRKQKASTPTDGAVEIGVGRGRGADPDPGVDGAGEKGTQGDSAFTQEREMPTSANVWELEGHAAQRPQELDANGTRRLPK